MGVTKEPPVRVAETGNGWMHGVGGGVSDVYSGGSDASISLCFSIRIIGQEVTWETLLIGTTLFIEIPSDILPVGSKESFVTLLEYAEEVLFCNHIIIYFKKNRADQKPLIRTFMFLGFVPVTPGTQQLAVSGDVMYLAYTTDSSGDSE